MVGARVMNSAACFDRSPARGSLNPSQRRVWGAAKLCWSVNAICAKSTRFLFNRSFVSSTARFRFTSDSSSKTAD